MTGENYVFFQELFYDFAKTIKFDTITMATALIQKFPVDKYFSHSEQIKEKILVYFKSVVMPHKMEVLKAGLDFMQNPAFDKRFNEEERMQFGMNLILHDLSKFSDEEAFGYAMYDRKTGVGKEAFERSWHHHKMNNLHHPEYWMNPNRGGQCEVLPMPTIYIIEMIADWIGAGKTYGSTLEAWLPENIYKFKFCNRGLVAEIIGDFTGINVKMFDGKLIVE